MATIDGDMPLIELAPITDVYVDDIYRMELLGTNVRVVYFRWRLAEDGATWQKVAADVAMVRPVASLRFPLKDWPRLLLIGAASPGRQGAALQ